MPIDIDKVLGAELPQTRFTWGPDQVILYHLGLGAGVPQIDPGELAYTYERDLKVLPSWGVIPVMASLMSMFSLDGLDINPAMLLHGEQEIEVHGPIPTAAEASTKATISDLFDKGKGALVILTTETSVDGELLFTNRLKAFIRGEGGWGGEAGPAPKNEAPSRAPDHVFEQPTIPQQALIYRLSGDKNPLHADPAFSAQGGFEVPILHGLCSYGIACKAVVDGILDGDTAAVATYEARFAGVFFPGETMLIKAWDEGETILLAAESKQRSAAVISNAAITRR